MAAGGVVVSVSVAVGEDDVGLHLPRVEVDLALGVGRHRYRSHQVGLGVVTGVHGHLPQGEVDLGHVDVHLLLHVVSRGLGHLASYQLGQLQHLPGHLQVISLLLLLHIVYVGRDLLVHKLFSLSFLCVLRLRSLRALRIIQEVGPGHTIMLFGVILECVGGRVFSLQLLGFGQGVLPPPHSRLP